MSIQANKFILITLLSLLVEVNFAQNKYTLISMYDDKNYYSVVDDGKNIFLGTNKGIYKIDQLNNIILFDNFSSNTFSKPLIILKVRINENRPIERPIIAKNKPIPAPIPNFKLLGIELISHALIGVNDIIKNNTPATNTAPKACCGVYPIPAQTPKATKALIPIPGARPIGQVFPWNAIMKQAKAVARIVAV